MYHRVEVCISSISKSNYLKVVNTLRAEGDFLTNSECLNLYKSNRARIPNDKDTTLAELILQQNNSAIATAVEIILMYEPDNIHAKEISKVLHAKDIKRLTPGRSGFFWFGFYYAYDFIGRELELDELYNRIHNHNIKGKDFPLTSCACVVEGIAGIGKTELVMKHAEAETPGYASIIVFKSSNIKVLHQEFRSVATYLGINVSENMKDNIESFYLHFGKSKTLIVFDGVNEFKNISPFLEVNQLSSHEINIVITTRKKKLIPNFKNVLTLSELSESDGGLMVEKYSHYISQTKSCTRIADELGFIPLAIAQAGAYFNKEVAGRRGNYFKWFLEIMKTDLTIILRFPKDKNQPDKTTLLDSWGDMFAEIQTKHGELAIQVLQLISKHECEIELSTINNYFVKSHNQHLRSCIQSITDNSLAKAKTVNGEELLVFNSLVHKAIRMIIDSISLSPNKSYKPATSQSSVLLNTQNPSLTTELSQLKNCTDILLRVVQNSELLRKLQTAQNSETMPVQSFNHQAAQNSTPTSAQSSILQPAQSSRTLTSQNCTPIHAKSSILTSAQSSPPVHKSNAPTAPSISATNSQSSHSPNSHNSAPKHVQSSSTQIVASTSQLALFTYQFKSVTKGHVLLINNFSFHYDYTNELERHGAIFDTKKLEDLFNEFGLNVVSKQNLTKNELETEIDVFKSLFTVNPADVCIVVLMSHGYKHNQILTSDRYAMHTRSNILIEFNNENFPQMIGKPKIFFFQSCRGENTDRGVTQADSTSFSRQIRIPTWTDMLVCYSTLEGHYAYRNSISGSWFIQIVCEVFREYGNTQDICTMLNIVSEKMKEKEGESGQKQICPWMNIGFTKKFYFFNNNNQSS